MFFTIYLDNNLDLNLSRPICANFSDMKSQEKKKVVKILYNNLENYVNWNGTNNNVITIDHIQHSEYTKPSKFYDDDTYPLMTISIYLNKKVNLIENPPNIDDVINVIENNCTMWDFDYGINDINLSVFKINNFEQCKNELEKISKINNFKIKKLKIKYYKI